MEEYSVVASIYNDLLTSVAVKKPFAQNSGLSTSIYQIRCNAIQEIPDLFLDFCGDECNRMKSRIHWYIDAGDGWILTDL